MKLKVFDLHCDTLDRLALSGDPAVPGGFYEHDAGVPRDRMSRLDDNDAHISLARMARFDWCQCFAVFVPDELRGDAAWSLFERVRRFWESETDRCSAKVARVRDAASAAAAFEQGRSAAMLTVEGCSFLVDDAQAEQRLDALAEAGVRMATLTWNGPNALGSGNDTSDGLTSFGRRMIRGLEERGLRPARGGREALRLLAFECAGGVPASAQSGGLATARDRRAQRDRRVELLQRVFARRRR